MGPTVSGVRKGQRSGMMDAVIPSLLHFDEMSIALEERQR